MYLSLKTKTLFRRRVAAQNKTFRWEVLGLQAPANTSYTPTIEDVRRQIISASHQGLSPDTLARSRKEQKRPKLRIERA